MPGRRNRGGANAIAAGRASRKETCRRERCRHAPGRLLLVARFKVVIVLIIVAHARFGLWFVSSHTLGTRPPPACRHSRAGHSLACLQKMRPDQQQAHGPGLGLSITHACEKKGRARDSRSGAAESIGLRAIAPSAFRPSRGSCSLYLYCTKRAFDAVPRPMEPPERAARGR